MNGLQGTQPPRLGVGAVEEHLDSLTMQETTLSKLAQALGGVSPDALALIIWKLEDQGTLRVTYPDCSGKACAQCDKCDYLITIKKGHPA